MKNKKNEELIKTQGELQGVKNQLARALADYQNLEKRMAADRESWIMFSGMEILLRLLPLIDTLKSVQAHNKEAEGLDLAIKQFETILNEAGVTPITAAGQQFDPKVMECVEAVAGEPDNQVAEETQIGYYYHDRVLRPARVKVYKKEI
jgi:molecular chaperone GrpE